MIDYNCYKCSSPAVFCIKIRGVMRPVCWEHYNKIKQRREKSNEKEFD